MTVVHRIAGEELADRERFLTSKRATKPRCGNGVQQLGLKIIKVLGSGSNNRVVLLQNKSGEQYVGRFPRRNSDTRDTQSAMHEAKVSMLGAERSFAPALYDLWFCASDSREQRRGLHMVMEFYNFDMHDAMLKQMDWFLCKRATIAEIIVMRLQEMANCGVLLYDLKTSNMVVDRDGTDVRFIDFGRDFCEHASFHDSASEITPILNALRLECSDATQYSRRLYLTMLVMLSASIHYELERSKVSYNISSHQRDSLHPLKSVARVEWAKSTANDVVSVKNVLRHEDMRKHLRHYCGRRNCGSRRTFRSANFGPVPS